MEDNIIAENGYVIIAVNPIEFKQAQCCAYSIKSKMPNTSVTLVVPDEKKVSKQYLEGFDALVELPFKQHTTRRQNDWQLYWCTPYENTIAIDCKSLVKEDQTSMWEYLVDHCEIAFPTQVNDIRQHAIKTKHQLYLESEYQLQVVYSGLFFFKRNAEALKHFKLADIYFQNWNEVYGTYLKAQHIPDFFEADVLHTLVANHSGSDVVTYHNMLDYIDMRYSVTVGALGKITKWSDSLTVWSSDAGKIKIQNYAVNSTIYYHENEFLTDDIFNEQQSYYYNATK